MAFKIMKVEYYFNTVVDQPGEAYKLLSLLEKSGINLYAFTAIPIGPDRTQLTLFPENSTRLTDEFKRSGFSFDGPHPAFLVQGDDELGALAEIHQKLFEANVNVYASSGVSDGRGSFGYLLYIKPEELGRAAAALKV